MGDEIHRFVELRLRNFKAFSQFSIRLHEFNIIVGPNNAGKSTILAAFRILAAAMRRASSRKPEIVMGPQGQTYGHRIDLSGLSVAAENIFHNYDDENPAEITFLLSNKNRLILFFAEQGSCVLIPELFDGRQCRTPSLFRSQFKCLIGFVPILGPVDHNEIRYEKEAARLALFNYGAARNFRNIWHHFPEKFEKFRNAVQATWPGMDIEPPETEIVDGKPRLFMYCPEERRAREIFWAGFGFQVWCQMLTHITQAENSSIFIIDEPDIYLHSDLQRQLISILREMHADVLIATHSTEIISEAEFAEIVVVNKKRRRASRVKDADQLSEVFQSLGSNLNPVLTQIAKSKKVIFVEGKDFQILGRLAGKAGFPGVASRRDFAVVPIKGFNPQKVKNLLEGFTAALGFTPRAACVLDRDFRSELECAAVEGELSEFCTLAKLLMRKEIENYLLVPQAIDRAAEERIADRKRRGYEGASYIRIAQKLLDEYCIEKKGYVTAQCAAARKNYERSVGSGLHEATITEQEIARVDASWDSMRLGLIPGKEALSAVNDGLREANGVNVTAYGVIQAMSNGDIPDDLNELFDVLSRFVNAG